MILKGHTALSTPFDNTGSILAATDVESAIKEIASTIASGIQNHNVISSTTFTTSSATMVAVTGMTVTPASGTWAAWINTSIKISVNNALAKTQIFKDGVAVADSLRDTTASGGNMDTMLSTMSVISVNGSQAIDMRAAVSSGSLEVQERTLLLIRLGS
jgi:hypothetical protein